MFNMNKKTILLLLLLCSKIIFSQNLVVNPSFEDYKGDLFYMLQFEIITNWYNLNDRGMYFRTDAMTDDVRIPKNYYGYQKAYAGKAYAGMFFDAKGSIKDNKSRTYICGELNDTLQKNTPYKIEYHISLMEVSNYSLNQFSILFSDTVFKYFNNNLDFYTKLEPQTSYCDTFISNKKIWTTITDTLWATGNEKYFVFGNFDTHIQYEYTGSRAKKQDTICRYYIDYFSIEPINDLLLKPNTPIILQNLTFKTGKAIIEENSFDMLNTLAGYLSNNQQYTLQINGYTDNTGDEDFNKKLSTERAKAVANYLIEKGINSNRISLTGYGSSNPIADNNTPQGRHKNRRVEIFLSE